MKSIKLISILIVLSLILPACAPGESNQSKTIPCDDFFANPHITDRLEVGAGDEFSVNLCSNPTTGFQWIETVSISDPSVTLQISHQFFGPDEGGESSLPGTPGSQLWNFKALEEGSSLLSFEYSRDWEGGEKGAWTYHLTIVVK
ncbi:MAG: protease inhibitor I42 family protein [Chloroflexota bacterium]